MRILVLAPHPDDEAIGCGGALCLHADRGDEVGIVYLTSGELGLQSVGREEAWAIREAEARNGCAVLGVTPLAFLRLPDRSLGPDAAGAATILAPILAEHRPDLIYLPHPDDDHPDHAAALPIARAALEKSAVPLPTLYAFEVWTPLTRFDHAQDISSVMRRKLTAVRTHRSQLAQYRYDRAMHGLAQFRGALAARCAFAEVFRELTAA